MVVVLFQRQLEHWSHLTYLLDCDLILLHLCYKILLGCATQNLLFVLHLLKVNLCPAGQA